MNKALSLLAGLATFFLYDGAERKFLARLNVDPRTPEAVTVFLSPPGSVADTFTGPTDKKTLAALVKNPPPGCGSGTDCGASKDRSPKK